MPLLFISSANSEEESEEKIGELIPPNVSSYSAKSYMTTNCMLDYLQFIREQFKSNVLIMVVDGQRLVNFFDHPIKIKLPKDMVFFSKIINFIYE